MLRRASVLSPSRRRRVIQYRGYELPGIYLLGTWVNKGILALAHDRAPDDICFRGGPATSERLLSRHYRSTRGTPRAHPYQKETGQPLDT